jgi:hypothetical protein
MHVVCLQVLLLNYVITALARLSKILVVFYDVRLRLHILAFAYVLLGERMSLRMHYVRAAFVAFLKMHVVF